MPVRKSSHRMRFFSRLILFVIAIAASGGAGFGWVRYHHRRPPSDQYATTGVRRANLYPTLMASGRVESLKRTVIECLLENVAVGVRGQRLYAGGASTLISVVPDGTMVKRGEILAELDSSDYLELLRVQRISVERAQADKLAGSTRSRDRQARRPGIP